MNRLPGAFRGVLMMMAVALGWLGLVRIWPENGFIGSSNLHVLSYPSWDEWMEVPQEVMTVAEVEERIEQWTITATGTGGELRSPEQGTGGEMRSPEQGTGGEMRSPEQGTGGEMRSPERGTGTGSGTELTGDSVAWARFHEFVDRMRDSAYVVHVFHFGDSQIEGDRFTEVLRKNLQAEFGGAGPGWLTVDAPSPTMTVNLVSEKDNCFRSTRYMVADSTLQDERFGWLACRTSCDSAATIAFEVHRRSSSTAATWDKTQLVLDTAGQPCPIQWEFADGLVVMDTIQGSDSALRRVELAHAGRALQRLVLPEGVDRLLGVGMWGQDSAGVAVHNVPMRGSSGTLFRKLDRQVLREQAAGLDVGCVLLQYGGNAVPYLKDSLAAERYGRWFGSNLRLIQEMFPEAAVVVLGNADMAENVNGDWVTRPLVENVRDALKAAAISEHAMFFDIYEAMGGRNSMGAWVAAEPALAAADHVHFTRRGSRLLAERLWALLFESEES